MASPKASREDQQIRGSELSEAYADVAELMAETRNYRQLAAMRKDTAKAIGLNTDTDTEDTDTDQ